MPAVQETIAQVRALDVDKYKYGFTTDIESDLAPKGLNEDIVRFISAKKNEPEWMTEWRLQAYRRWLGMKEPTWARVHYPKIDYQDLHYYAAPKRNALDEPRRGRSGNPEDLCAPRHSAEGAGDPRRRPQGRRGGGRVRVGPRRRRRRVRFRLRRHDLQGRAEEGRRDLHADLRGDPASIPDLVKKYLGSVVPITDNFFATLNSAVFSDGSFVYVPKGVRCPMELSTYFRMNEKNTGQFERTLIIADEGSYVSYLEGCTAPMRDENQLHAAVVELVALDDAEIKYSTVQNWYPGDKEGQGRRLQLRHQARRLPRQALEDFLDAGGDRLGHHLEVSVLHPARRQFARRVLFDRHLERLPAGRFRHQDDPSRQEHVEPHHLQGHRRRAFRQHLSRPRLGAPPGRGRAQLHQLRLAADRRQVRRAHRALHRVEELLGDLRARGDDVEDLRRPALLLPPARHERRGGDGASSSTASSATCCSSSRWSSWPRRRS